MFKPPKILRFESELIRVSDMTDSVKEFVFSTPKDFTFVAGQFATILFEADGKKYRRPYSIASTPSQTGSVNFCIKAVEGGPGTKYLWSRKIGDKVCMMGPLGVFVVKEEHMAGPLTFVSTGTGIGPFVSVVTHLLENGFKNKITLICGFREHLLYDEHFVTLSKKYPNLEYAAILSRPANKSYSGSVGRVQQLLTNPDVNANYYICGLYEMIEQTCRTLASAGVKKENIHFERYD